MAHEIPKDKRDYIAANRDKPVSILVKETGLKKRDVRAVLVVNLVDRDAGVQVFCSGYLIVVWRGFGGFVWRKRAVSTSTWLGASNQRTAVSQWGWGNGGDFRLEI